MASQVVGKSACYYEWPSYVRGYHEYKNVWSPTIRETCRRTLRLTTELTNPQDSFTVVVMKVGCVVGHVPRKVSRTVSFFLGKDGSVGFCEVTGAIVNRTTGFGLEIPCVYWFYGCQAYIERLKDLLLNVVKNFTDCS